MKKSFYTLILFCVIGIINAQQKAGSINYQKQKALSVLEIEGYQNSHIKMADTTKNNKQSYTIYKRNGPLSNNFIVEMNVSYGPCGKYDMYNGNLAAYKKKPAGKIIRGPKENLQPNTRDTSWVITINNKKVILNYYYCFFTNESAEFIAKSTMLAYYDDGTSCVYARILPAKSITPESGRTKLVTEQEFKSKLPTIKELADEVTKGITVFLNNL